MIYSATYEDRRGAEETTIRNDGATLRIVIRGVEFSGCDFDCLAPSGPADPAALSAFTLNHGDLCDCRLRFRMPLAALFGEGELEGELRAALELGGPAANGGIEREVLRIEYVSAAGRFESSGFSGFFEDELTEISALMPPDACLKCCFSCTWSDYFPGGHGLFGDLACFRNKKEDYLAVRSKDDLFALWPARAGFVQETYLCAEFARRRPGTGYRG